MNILVLMRVKLASTRNEVTDLRSENLEINSVVLDLISWNHYELKYDLSIAT